MSGEGEVPREIRAAARGDRAAAGAVLRRLLPRARNLVRYLIRGDADVDDITQTALLAVLRGLPSYRGDAPLEPWADRIVARETFRFLRGTRLRSTREVGFDDPEAQALRSPASAEAAYLARREAVTRLDRLPEAQRVAVALHHAAGFTVPEIAELLDVPPETVRSRIRLGMARLRADDDLPEVAG